MWQGLACNTGGVRVICDSFSQVVKQSRACCTEQTQNEVQTLGCTANRALDHQRKHNISQGAHKRAIGCSCQQWYTWQNQIGSKLVKNGRSQLLLLQWVDGDTGNATIRPQV